MRKALGVMFLGLVAAAATLFWLHPAALVPEHSSGTAPEAGVDPQLVREHAELMRRVAALEEQMNQRVSDEAANTAALRLQQERMAANASGDFNQGADGGASVSTVEPRVSGLTVEAVAAAAAGRPVNAPPSLVGLRAEPGQVLVMRVTGSAAGTVWGSDTYTDDSPIAAAAVHSGALCVGETGTLMLTLQPGTDSYPAVPRNGISSHSFGAWGRGYIFYSLEVERLHRLTRGRSAERTAASGAAVVSYGTIPLSRK